MGSLECVDVGVVFVVRMGEVVDNFVKVIYEVMVVVGGISVVSDE